MTSIRSAIGACCDTYLWILAAVALNAPLVALILLRDLAPVPFTPLTAFYFASVALGYYTLALSIVVTAAYLVSFPWRRIALGASAAILAAALFFLLVDSQAYAIYRVHIDFFWLNLLLRDYSGLGVSTSLVVTALVALAGIIGLEMGILILARRLARRRLLPLAFGALLIVAFGVSQVLHIAAYERNDMRITVATPHLPFYMPLRSHSHAVRYGDKIPFIAQTALRATAPEGHGPLAYPLHEPRVQPHASGRPPNILIVFLESWRFDTMDEAVSPRIHALAQKSTVFLNHFSSGNSTVAGTFGFFYGIHPTYWEAVKANSAQIHNPVLIDVLQDYGYDFGIFAESHFERHKIKDTVFQGIDIHNAFAHRDKVEKDKELTGELIAFLDRHGDDTPPFLAFAFYKASHFDYSYDEAHRRFRPTRKLNLALARATKDPEFYFNDYRNAVYFDDMLVGNVIDELETSGKMKNTIVILTTDHGEEFDDNASNYWGHSSNYTQFQTRVPLIIYYPDRPPARVTQVTSHIDIAPTLLRHYLGCTNDIRDYSDGLDLLGELPVVRPLVIASYFNHAFVIGHDVYESRPFSLKTYKLEDINQTAADAPVKLLRSLIRELGRFYGASTLTAASERPLLAGPSLGGGGG